MKHVLVSYLVCMSFLMSAVAQKDIFLGVRDTVYSNLLQENRKIWVYVPKQLPGQAPKQFPVVYLLDGDDHFISVCGIIDQQSAAAGNDRLPEMIVVAILNTDRDRDMTPTHMNYTFGDTTGNATTGGLSNFVRFMETELFPHVESNYPAAPHRTFIGHSLGGLAVLHTMVERPDLFNNYIAIDASLWWDNSMMLNLARENFEKKSYKDENLYLAIANTLFDGITLDEALADTSAESFFIHIQALHQFAELADQEKLDGLQVNWKYYPNEGHTSMPLIATYDGLRSQFEWYGFDDSKIMEFFNPQGTQTPEELIRLFTDHAIVQSENLGYTVLPDESSVNQMGYIFLANMMPHMALACFELNVNNYPQSSNVYDSLGDYYLSQDNTVKAKESFEKALSLWENKGTRSKLNALLQQE